MIRSLAPDELEWFIASYYDFLGHSDPRHFARRTVRTMQNAAHHLESEAERSFILFAEGDVPLAGAHIIAPESEDDDQNLYLSNIWFKRDAQDLRTLLNKLLRKFDHEAVHCPLYNFSEARLERVEPIFESLGFKLRHAYDLEFELSELPPLGTPLVLEAWSDESDALFQEVFKKAEGSEPSDGFWAWLKRWRGPFRPNLWFLASETLDQEPVGYAFYGVYRDGVDGVYYLTAAGVLAEYRDSSDMLKRLMISSMHELAARSPFGLIQTLVTQQDPKLIEILESLGFRRRDAYPAFIKRPE